VAVFSVGVPVAEAPSSGPSPSYGHTGGHKAKGGYKHKHHEEDD
jgi:hypothetical protein